ncbi:MAG: hypothetical protein AAGE52_32285 [Myxococcota bacterium]
MARTLFLAMIALGVACGDDDGTPGMDAATGDSGGDDDSGVPDNGVVGDDFYDESCLEARRCRAGQLESACVCVPEPAMTPEGMPDVFDINLVGCGQLEATGEVVRTPDIDFCDGEGNNTAVNTACLQDGGFRTRGEVQMVTFFGVVDVFGNGGDAENITVEIFEEGPDGMLGPMLGSATALISDPCSEQEDEIENDMVVGTRQLGFYAIPNIPTETPLIIRTSGDRDFWRDIYAYNIQAENEELITDPPAADACETLRTSPMFDGVPRYDYRARILSSSDYTSIPLTSGLVDGIRPTSGAVAGEVHDCDDVRIEFAQAATLPEPEVFTYFNDNPDNPIPDTGRMVGTSLLGLYAALDIPAGPVDIAAVGRSGDQTVTLGWYRARVFEGSVTSVTLRGFRWQQIPGASSE